MRRILCTGFVVCSALASPAQASVIAIVDSGVDYKHEQLAKNIWINPGDSSFDRIDNDRNGFTDDVYGWNFIENSGQVIDYKYGKLYDEKIERFFRIQDEALAGTASAEDIAWLQESVKDPEVFKQVFTYGNYAHGTHVAGIARGDNPDAQVLVVKLVPTENPLAGLAQQVEALVEEGKSPNWLVKQLIKGGLGLFAKAQGLVFGQIGDYVGKQNADVANLSLGVGVMQARAIVTPLLQLAAGGKTPPAKDVDEFSAYFLERLNIEQEQLFKKAPSTLFVFAAGNDGLSNDKFPTAPASIQNPNGISVAAVFSSGTIAPFSNYGQKVDVAATGVAVLSSVPDNNYLKLSGTSQAAPFIASVAGRIKDINPALNPAQIKEIIMKTVDVKAELKDKVKSSGIVNAERAYAAAEASLSMNLASAISGAKAEVSDAERPRADPRVEAAAPYVAWQPAFLF